VVGTVKITKLFGIVEATLGNHTGVYWDLWDGTRQLKLQNLPGRQQ